MAALPLVADALSLQFAAWGYSTNTFPGRPAAAAAAALDRFYNGVLGPYWSPRRELLEAHYAGMEPPSALFSHIERIAVPMRRTVTFAQYIGYLRTWSAYHAFRRAHPTLPDPMDEAAAQLSEALGIKEGDDSAQFDIEWPLFVILAVRADRGETAQA